MKDTNKSAKNATANDTKFEGFTDEGRGVMKEHALELKATAHRGRRGQGGRGNRRAHKDRGQRASPRAETQGTGCPRMPRSSASPKAHRSSNEVRDVRLQRRGEPRQRRHVTDRGTGSRTSS
jgi:hypothetical protein